MQDFAYSDGLVRFCVCLCVSVCMCLSVCVCREHRSYLSENQTHKNDVCNICHRMASLRKLYFVNFTSFFSFAPDISLSTPANVLSSVTTANTAVLSVALSGLKCKSLLCCSCRFVSSCATLSVELLLHIFAKIGPMRTKVAHKQRNAHIPARCRRKYHKFT